MIFTIFTNFRDFLPIFAIFTNFLNFWSIFTIFYWFCDFYQFFVISYQFSQFFTDFCNFLLIFAFLTNFCNFLSIFAILKKHDTWKTQYLKKHENNFRYTIPIFHKIAVNIGDLRILKIFQTWQNSHYSNSSRDWMMHSNHSE